MSLAASLPTPLLAPSFLPSHAAPHSPNHQDLVHAFTSPRFLLFTAGAALLPSRCLSSISPDSSSKRSQRQRESDDAEREMSIERGLCMIDMVSAAFQFPYPSLLKWKYQRVEWRLTSPQFKGMVSVMNETLGLYGLDTSVQRCSMDVQYLSKLDCPRGGTRRSMLTIRMPTLDAPPVLGLGPAKNAIASLLRMGELPHEVELLDIQRTYPPHLFLVFFEEPSLPSVRKDIIRL